MKFMQHKVEPKKIISNDWRITFQEDYLMSALFEKKKYQKKSIEWDHDHCEFCEEKFSEDPIVGMSVGYYTENRESWVCEQCFNDFKDLFMFGLK